MARSGVISTKLVLENANKYNADLKQVKSNLKEFQSELKLCTQQYANTANSVEALSKKEQILTKMYDEAEKNVKTYTAVLKDAAPQLEKLQKNQDALNKEYTESKEKLQQLESEGKKQTDEYQKQEAACKELETQLNKANAEYNYAVNEVSKYQTALNNATTEQLKYDNELKTTRGYLEEADKSLDGCATSIDQYGNEVESAGKKTSQFGELVKSALTADVLMKGVEALARGIKAAADAAFEVGTSFEAGMSKVAAISGATGQELDALTEKAKEMGAKTMFSATESADAFSYMAMAGWKSKDMLDGIEPIMNLAAASGAELATVSDIITDDLTALGLTAKDAARMTDVFAAASSNANTNVEMMGETFKYAAPVAGSLGYSLEDLALATSLMANSGIKASQAGTSLRSWMSRMAAPTKQVQVALNELGISLTDSEGNMYSFRDLMINTREAMSGLSETEKTAAASAIAGKNAMSGFLAVINSSDEDFDKLANAIDNSTGSAEKMANVMQDNLKGKITILQSALEGLGIEVYDVFGEELKTGVGEATKSVERLQDAVRNGDLGVSLHKMSEALGEFIENGASLAEDVLPVLVDGLTWLLNNGPEIAGAISGMMAGKLILEAVEAWKAFKVATEGATVAQWLLNAAMEANPVGLLVMGISGLVGVLGAFALTAESAADETDKLAEAAERNKKATDDIAEANKNEASELARARDIIKELSYVENLNEEQKAELRVAVDKLNAASGDLGLTINEETGHIEGNTEAILDNVDAMLKQFELTKKQEELDAVIESIYENNLLLEEAQEKLNQATADAAEKQNELGEAMGNTLLLMAAGPEAMMPYAQAMSDANDTVTAMEEDVTNLQNIIDEQQNHANELAAEIEESSASIEENIAGVADAADGAATVATDGIHLVSGGLRELTEDEQDLLEKTTETVTEFSGMFEQMATTAETSMKEVAENLSANADAMSNYADNIHKAMEIANEAEGDTGNATKAVVNYLISMGVDGAAELDAFVKSAEEKSSDYNDVITNFGEFETARSDAVKAIQDWNAGVNDGWDDIILTTKTKSDEQCDALDDGLDDIEELYDDHRDTLVEKASQTQQDIAQATLDEKETVSEASATVAQAAVDTVSATWGVDSGTSSVFYDLGQSITNSLAQSIRDGSGSVGDAVRDLCENAVNNVDISGVADRIESEVSRRVDQKGAANGNK